MQKSKRKKPNEYSQSPKKINGKPEELDKRNNSTGIKLDSCKGLLSKTSRRKQTASITTCKIETEALQDSDVLIIDGGKEPASERSPVPGKLDLPLGLELFYLFSLLVHVLFSLIDVLCNVQAMYIVYKTRSGSLTH